MHDLDILLDGDYIKNELLKLEPAIGKAMAEVIIEQLALAGVQLESGRQYSARLIRDALQKIIGMEGAQVVVMRIVAPDKKMTCISNSTNRAQSINAIAFEIVFTQARLHWRNDKHE